MAVPVVIQIGVHNASRAAAWVFIRRTVQPGSTCKHHTSDGDCAQCLCTASRQEGPQVAVGDITTVGNCGWSWVHNASRAAAGVLIRRPVQPGSTCKHHPSIVHCQLSGRVAVGGSHEHSMGPGGAAVVLQDNANSQGAWHSQGTG